VVAVVFNNGGWEAVHKATVGIYPDSYSVQYADSVKDTTGMAPLCSLGPTPAFERYAEVSNGVGIRVTEKSALPDALRRAMTIAQSERRQVLVHVIGRG